VDHPAAREDSKALPAMLIAAIAAGDDAAFRQVYDLRAGRLYGIALRITRQGPLAADAVQDAFLELWRNAGRFDARRGDPDVWLASLVRYRALDIARRLHREVPSDDLPEPVDTDPDPLERMVTSSDTAALRECLDTLKPDRRTLLSLAFLDGLSHSELAARLHVPIGSVKTWIRRGLHSLRVCLEGEA